MRGLAALVLLALSSCRPLTPAEEAVAVRASIDGGRAACFIATKRSLALTPAQSAWCGCTAVK
jgi:hypothetical protein